MKPAVGSFLTGFQLPRFAQVSPAYWSRWRAYLTQLAGANAGASITGQKVELGIPNASAYWSTGVLAPNGKIYCSPLNGSDILIIDTSNNTWTRSAMGADLTGASKWGAGVLGNDGKIYCIPATANDILVIDPVAGTATRTTMGASLSGSGNKWLGGVLGADGKIYGVPLTAADILIIDPVAGSATRSAMGAVLNGTTSQWRYGALAPNGKIYCAPYLGSDILIIDTLAGTATRSTMGATFSGTSSAGGTLWNGAVLARNGKIFCVPADTTSLLVIDPAAGTASLALSPTTTSNGSKWRSGVLAPDGLIYLIPSNENAFGIIDPLTNTGTRNAFGITLSADGNTIQTLCSGGVLGVDGALYAIPFNGSAYLRLSGWPRKPRLAALLAGLFNHG